MPIFVRARSMPMVLTNRSTRCFWSAKMCSTQERTRDRAGLLADCGLRLARPAADVNLRFQARRGNAHLVLL